MGTHGTNNSRFDTRLPLEQKNFFERAAQLGGYRSLTDFVILAAQEKATEIIQRREEIISSERDKMKFFNALMNVAEPNNSLMSAAEEFKKAL